MREILFRAKRVDNGEWVKGYFWRGVDHIYMIPSHVGIGYDDKIKHMSAYAVEVEPETVCQYTGITDKNGNRIWENDIVKIGANTLVRWSEKYAGWCLVQRGWMYEHFFGEAIDERDCEVVGNVFDNPELMEK